MTLSWSNSILYSVQHCRNFKLSISQLVTFCFVICWYPRCDTIWCVVVGLVSELDFFFFLRGCFIYFVGHFVSKSNSIFDFQILCWRCTCLHSGLNSPFLFFLNKCHFWTSSLLNDFMCFIRLSSDSSQWYFQMWFKKTPLKRQSTKYFLHSFSEILNRILFHVRFIRMALICEIYFCIMYYDSPGLITEFREARGKKPQHIKHEMWFS